MPASLEVFSYLSFLSSAVDTWEDRSLEWLESLTFLVNKNEKNGWVGLAHAFNPSREAEAGGSLRV